MAAIGAPSFRANLPNLLIWAAELEMLRFSVSRAPVPKRDPSMGQPSLSWRLRLLEAVADAVERLDHVEIVVRLLELLAQPLDVAVDGAIVDIDLVVVGSVHERVARLYYTRARGERLQDQELGYRQHHGVPVPVASVALGIEPQLAPLEHAGRFGGRPAGLLRLEAAQHGFDALHHQALRERLGDVVVG